MFIKDNNHKISNCFGEQKRILFVILFQVFRTNIIYIMVLLLTDIAHYPRKVIICSNDITNYEVIAKIIINSK